MSTKTLTAGILAGIVAFLLGWIIYGMALMGYMTENMNNCAQLPEEEWTWWALVASNLLLGIFMALVLGWANTANAAAGFKNGALLGILLGLNWDLLMFSMSTMFNSIAAVVVDVLAFTVMLGILGAFLGWFMNRGKAAPAAS